MRRVHNINEGYTHYRIRKDWETASNWTVVSVFLIISGLFGIFFLGELKDLELFF